MQRAFDPSKCGTPRGRDQHRHRGESPCEPCRVAWNQVTRERLRALREAGHIRPGRSAPQRLIRESACSNCASPMKTYSDTPMCKKCRSRANRGIYIRPADRLAIYERDGWTCGICSEPVDSTLSGRDQRGPTLDHIKPRSLGGSDDPTNLRIAHRACNSARGNRVA